MAVGLVAEEVFGFLRPDQVYAISEASQRDRLWRAGNGVRGGLQGRLSVHDTPRGSHIATPQQRRRRYPDRQAD